MQTITTTIRRSGGSAQSIEDAVTTVLGRAALTISDIHSFDIVKAGGTVDGSGVPADYTVTLDITFTVRESLHG
jgi:flavin-binding protein dodecin